MTPREATALRYITGYIEAHGYGPGYREIATGIGVNSMNAVSRPVHALNAAGHIRMTKANGNRAIEPVTVLPLPRAPDGAPLHSVTPPAGAAPGAADSMGENTFHAENYPQSGRPGNA